MKGEIGEREIELIRKLLGLPALEDLSGRIFDLVVSELRGELSFDWAVLMRGEGDKVRIKAVYPPDLPCRKESALLLPEDAGLREAMRSGRIVVKRDLLGDPTSSRHLVEKLDTRSAIYIPLVAGGALLGALVLGSRNPNAFSDRERELMKGISPSLSLLLRMELMFEEAAWKERALRTVGDITKILFLTRDVGATLSSIYEKLREIIPSDHLSIVFVEDEKIRYFGVVPEGEKGEIKTGATFPLSDSPLSWIIEHGRTLIEDDLKRERSFPLQEIFWKEGFRSAIRVPIFHEGRIIGSLDLASRSPRAYGEREREVCEQLVACISGALELHRLYKLEQRERQRVEKIEEERKDFINALAHELKTPLTAIIGSVNLLNEEFKAPPTSPYKRLVLNILRSAQNMERRINELLDLARVEAPGFKVDLRPLKLEPVLYEIAESCYFIPEKRQTLTLEMESSLPLVKADRGRLEQVLYNLLSNASKFTPEGGKITLRAESGENEVVISVSDTGPGIPEEERERLFEPYQRGWADRQKLPGLGLGLALSKKLVELHGGRMWVESKVGEGSTFYFTLPICESPEEDVGGGGFEPPASSL